MIRITLISVIGIAFLSAAQVQLQATSLIEFEKNIEKAIVAADENFLKNAYADDFYFKHGTGAVDSKASWIAGVLKNKGQFVSRETDSVEVEMHDQIAFTQGKLTVHRTNGWYVVYYIRAYRKKGSGWELLMHRTYRQTDH